MTVALKLAVVVTFGSLASACAANGTFESAAGPMTARGERATVEVENNNWSDIVVYALHHSSRERLGMVTSMTTERFDLSRVVSSAAGDVRLIAALIGSDEEYATEPIFVHPGQRVELRLENVLQISNWSVW